LIFQGFVAKECACKSVSCLSANILLKEPLMRRIDLMRQRRIITVEELEFGARLAGYIDQQETKWIAQDKRRGRLPTKQERDNRALWRHQY
jgi:hypothetical protein